MAGLKAEDPLRHVHPDPTGLLEHVLPGEAGYALACQKHDDVAVCCG